MQLRRENFLDEVSNIFIDIYLIGYSKQGESIVFILYAKEPVYRVIYSIVIDCFEENINATKELLDEILTDKLDMLIWTHPHDDHTKGISTLINKYCSKDTKIISANILGEKNIKLSRECRNLERKLSSLNKKLKNKYDINHMVHFDNSLKYFSFEKADAIKSMEIRCIAPISGINARQAGNSKIHPNIICVAVIVEIILKNGKKMNFLFSGDIENEVLLELGKLQEDFEIPNTYNFIKIPHHGGRSAEKMKEILNSEKKSEYAATTIFIKEENGKKNTNPDIELLKEYKEYIDNIGCTSDVVNNKYGFGMIRVNYSLSYTKEKQYTVDTFINAVEKIV